MNGISEIISYEKPIIINELVKLKSKVIGRGSFKIEHQSHKENPYRLLLIADCEPNAILTIRQTVYELIEHSTFTIDLLNVWGGVPRVSKKRVNEYDGIILHNTVSYTRSKLDVLNELIVKKFEGIKILMKQDEHYRTNEIVDFVIKNKFDLVLSLWSEEMARKVYASKPGSNIEVMQYLTGYVPENYKNLCYKEEGRKIDIGYRGSIQPIIFGRLCYEKRKIGEDFRPYAVKRGMKVDISSKQEDRFGGQDWLDFLGSCKSVLGVESGSYIVDFDGTVNEGYKRYIAQHPQASDEEILAFLEPYEHGVPYCAISPRHFEAAACRTLQVMYEGEFQGIFKANRHYIPLKRDFSNVEEVMDSILDGKIRKDVVDCAFEEIIMNEEYSFHMFIKKFDRKILELIERK